jgi:hypothetical protein
MNIHDLREAQVHFEGQIEDVLKSRKDLYKLRDNFAKYYSHERINTMPIDHYAIGNELPKKESTPKSHNSLIFNFYTPVP